MRPRAAVRLDACLLAGCFLVACSDNTGPDLVSVPIVFQSDRSGEFDLYSIHSSGGTVVNLTVSAAREFHAAWSPDHTQIAFVSGDTLSVMNADGTARHAVSSPTGPGTGYPAWAPHGRSLVFEATRSGRAALWTVGADGSGLRQLTDLRDGESVASWSPDGQRIVFDCLSGDLWEINADGTGLRRLVPAAAGWNAEPAWSPTGAQLAFVRLAPTPSGNLRRLYVARSDGSESRQLTEFPDGQDWTPAWSPDGTRIVFVHDVGGQFDLYIVNADGTGQHRITENGGIQFRPTW